MKQTAWEEVVCGYTIHAYTLVMKHDGLTGVATVVPDGDRWWGYCWESSIYDDDLKHKDNGGSGSKDGNLDAVKYEAENYLYTRLLYFEKQRKEDEELGYL